MIEQVFFDFMPHLLASSYRLFAGMSFGFFVGGLIGMICGLYPRINCLMSPLLYLAYTFPKVILIPIVIFVFGLDDLAKIILVAFITIFQVAFPVRDHIAHIPESYLKLFFSFKASFLQKFFYLFLPYSLPCFLTCLKVNLGSAIAMLFFSETYATSLGVGYYIWDAFARFDYLQLGLGCLFFTLFNLGLFFLINYLSLKTLQKL